ncbi:M24 family metallopeptidase [Allosediminivita pacifica]|uniref:Xaa-Pro dipeptidase n=1 Tax=Allosediminivita pacifica TaxID=1267769 RepID=A0A2T6ANF7_9RHOB|nr:Xaa-Pro peptidase family protein [Allosediminivita pacifica]PTX45361.1 Xaa-Pro dipeptidase [Allosediminivita pacifica]GGB20646.1 Xaa-Pro dipeptidase [Allosediminivita pacifica]
MTAKAQSLLPFPKEDLLARQNRLRAALRERGADAMLVFSQESLFWLTGYDSGGFVFFQCALVTADDRPIVLLTRRPDLLQAKITSTIEDVRIWWDADDANPAADLKDILEEHGLGGGRVLIELNTHGLTGWNLWRCQTTFGDWCRLEDDEQLIRKLRLVKSPAEIEIMREAGRICDRSLDAVIDTARPGLLDSDLKAAYLASILGDGADMPPNAPIFNSGERAVFGRGVTAPRRLSEQDQIMVEYPVAYRHYNVKTEWTILFGKVPDQQRQMYDVGREVLAKMTDLARPGNTLGEIFDAYADGLDSAGYGRARYGATGYSVGISYAPTSMDVPPMIYPGASLVCEPGMTLFYHVMNGDGDSGLAMGVGHTLVVTEGAPEVITGLPDDLTVIT